METQVNQPRFTSRHRTTLSTTGNVQGLFKIGNLRTGYTSGYMGFVPSGWQAAFGGNALAGNCCLSIITRTSFGPAVFAFNLAMLAALIPFQPIHCCTIRIRPLH